MLSTCSSFSVGALLATCAFAQSPVLAEWSLDEAAGVTAVDSGTLGNDGTLYNFGAAPWVAGMFGNALSFDGVDDYVAIDAPTALPVYRGFGEPYSVSFWVKAPAQNDRRCYSEGPNPSPTGQRALFTIGTGRTSNGTTDRIQIYIRTDSSVWIELYSASTVFDDTWHHVAWGDTSGFGRLYVDGVLDAASFDYRTSGIGPQTDNHGPFTMNTISLGAVLRESACCHMSGALDDVRVFRSALSATDVSIIMGGGPVVFCSSSVGKFGVGCGAGPLDITWTGALAFGGALDVQLTNAPVGGLAFLSLGVGAVQPLDLGAVGFGGCTLYPFNPITFGIGTIDGAGTSPVVSLPISGSSTLMCVYVTLQGIVANAPTVELSPALVAQVGL